MGIRQMQISFRLLRMPDKFSACWRFGILRLIGWSAYFGVCQSCSSVAVAFKAYMVLGRSIVIVSRRVGQ